MEMAHRFACSALQVVDSANRYVETCRDVFLAVSGKLEFQICSRIASVQIVLNRIDDTMCLACIEK